MQGPHRPVEALVRKTAPQRTNAIILRACRMTTRQPPERSPTWPDAFALRRIGSGPGRFGVALVVGVAAQRPLAHGRVVLPGLVILLSEIALGLRHARLLLGELDCIL